LPLKRLIPGFVMRARFLARSLVSVAAVVLLAGGLAGCKTAGLSDITGSLGPRAAPADADPHHAIAVLGERYRANPRDADLALRYGQALRATLDHRLLNNIEGLERPTLENLARFIWQRVETGGELVRVTVRRDSCFEACSYFGP
jgi:hypothetical protein